ncbi:hypothetical protein BJ508DRAFT_175835 [Ascobolus immersus RN42]|uniref:Uncharacterized protein n=1 Tax=Ascobolus immersus RN42 TaxID=1160509 RepID=A0A3N4HT48_ASCIM|nr:hypothetical protein BJ508DRAFT_175835 [Ascobolus immersus RN42]
MATSSLLFSDSLLAAELQTNAKIIAISIPQPRAAIRNINGELNYDTSDLVVWNSSLPSSQYEDDSSSALSGSLFPAAFDLAYTHSEAHEIDIFVEVEQDLVGQTVTVAALHGTESNLLSDSSAAQAVSFEASGINRLRVSLDPTWADKDVPWGITGDVFWTLTVTATNQTIPLNPTRLELYAIKYPLAPLFKNEIPVKFLRNVAAFSGGQASASWPARVAELTINKFGFKYDNVFGGHRYCNGYDGEFFRLDAYLEDINNNGTVNCYDQAGIVQLCLSLSEATSNTLWYFMEPLGYIHTNWLVGWGLTNNPFFGNAPRQSPDQICDNDDDRRSHFGNHAFIGVNTTDEEVPIMIVDSTIGPYRGRLTLESYMKFTTQSIEDTTRYNDTNKRPGTINDVDALMGIETLEPGRMFEDEAVKVAAVAKTQFGSSSVTKRWLGTRALRLDSLLQKALAHSPPATEVSSNMNFTDFFAAKDVRRSSVEIVEHGTFAEWILNDGATRVEVTVSKDHECAQTCFKNLITAYNNPPDFKQAPIHRQKGQLTLETTDSGTRGILAWVHGNIMVRITSEVEEYAHELSDELHAAILEKTTPLSRVALPVVEVTGWPSSSINSGEKFTVTVASNTRVHANIRSSTGNVLLLKKDESKALHTYTFLALNSGKDAVSFLFSDYSTLRSSHTTLHLEIR